MAKAFRGRVAARRVTAALRAGARRGAPASATPENQEAYNRAMQAYSNSPYEYQHDVGLYYHYITPNLLVGTQPQDAEAVDRLAKDEGVTCIFNTQQDKDMAYWKVDFGEIEGRCKELGVRMERRPFPDFSADGLREGLPSAVGALDVLLRDRDERVYLHCTAGMGRSPGVAIGWLYWCSREELPGAEVELDAAYEFLTSRRPCGPNKEAIRRATCDALAANATRSELRMLPDEALSPEPAGTTLTQEQRAALTAVARGASGLVEEEPAERSSVLMPLAAMLGVGAAAVTLAQRTLSLGASDPPR